MTELQQLEETVLENYKSHDFAKGQPNYSWTRAPGVFTDPIRHQS